MPPAEAPTTIMSCPATSGSFLGRRLGPRGVARRVYHSTTRGAVPPADTPGSPTLQDGDAGSVPPSTGHGWRRHLGRRAGSERANERGAALAPGREPRVSAEFENVNALTASIALATPLFGGCRFTKRLYGTGRVPTARRRTLTPAHRVDRRSCDWDAVNLLARHNNRAPHLELSEIISADWSIRRRCDSPLIAICAAHRCSCDRPWCDVAV